LNFWLIAIRVQIAQIGARIVGMNMLTRCNVRESMANRLAVLNHVLITRDITQRKFMPASDILTKRDDVVINTHLAALRQIIQRYSNVILRMDLDELHINPRP